MQYSMLLGTQILGSLIAAGHNGSVKIKSQEEIFSIWFSSGTITTLRSSKNSEQETLPMLLSTTNGEIEMKPETITTVRLNYPVELEKKILESQVNFKTQFPLASHIQVSSAQTVPGSELSSCEKIKTLQIRSDTGISLSMLESSMPEKDFWNTFVLASSIGCLNASYRVDLTNCILRYHELLDGEIKKFMGAAISQSFNKKIDHSIIEWKDQFTNPIYGVKPFESWIKAIQISALEIVPSSISGKMLAKVLSMLAPEDQKVIRMFA